MAEFRIEALKEVDEIATLPIQRRVTALENILRRLLVRGKSKASPSTTFADDVPISLRINEERQRFQVNEVPFISFSSHDIQIFSRLVS